MGSISVKYMKEKRRIEGIRWIKQFHTGYNDGSNSFVQVQMDPQHNMPQLQETIIVVYPSLRYELEVTKEWGYKQFRYFCNGSLRYKDRRREHAI
uniref:Uncharacterized protein n=1 Tax=Oryza sativa subsp. japonica TaxID=39947 RepID=Q338F1_ORYSJ|nr:hypothetical protein LOC_Os10g26800 [Oryza sativa Japonica Group]